MLNTINEYKIFLNQVARKKEYYFTLLLFIFISYGFYLFNRTVYVDDLCRVIYLQDELTAIKGFRWFQIIWFNLLSTVNFNFFIDYFVAIVMLVASSTLFSACIYFVLENNDVWIYSIFSSIYVCYPLINEMWPYSGAISISMGGMACVSFALLYQLTNKKHKFIYFLICGFLLVPASSGFEAAIFAYISFVFILLLLKEIKGYYKTNKYSWFYEGLLYTVPLMITIIIKYVIGYILIKTCSLEVGQGGATSIIWFESIKDGFIQLLYNAWYYFVRGLSYFPLGEFAIASFLFLIYLVISLIRKQTNRFIIGILLLLSLFSVSILRGHWMVYETATTLYIFVPFVAMLLFIHISKNAKVIYSRIFILLALFLCFRQSLYINNVMSLNNLMSENEANVIRTLGYEIYSKYDKDKEVIFCGEYYCGDYIDSQITINENSVSGKIELYIRNLTGHNERKLHTRFIYCNLNSTLNWSRHAYNGKIMKELFSYYGYDINAIDDLPADEEKFLSDMEIIAIEEKMKPLEVKDMGDYILVYLGPTFENIK